MMTISLLTTAWDWTTEGNRTALFVPDKLGEPDDDGNLMDSWYIVCVNATGHIIKDTVCDPTTTAGNRRIVRCGRSGHCGLPDWPDEKNVNNTFKRFRKYRKDTTRPTKFDTKF